ncbi:hypothetical protein TOPH_03331 [Tolypocladium ophioglossoides CBS 100239]|uniref:Uncharacterized protein n=1 Tax=Tolypocladium ophioglossoides (strain CBS 100239) TaxID=1163406 RepID=A0A0L0NE77_TOLOC|nr:hypothetical protein TOPH_03331 [Tolypocladium ophioglossoides CBS 100239]
MPPLRRRTCAGTPGVFSLALLQTLDHAITNGHAELTRLLATNPSIVSNIRSILPAQVYDGPVTPADTPSPAGPHVHDRLAATDQKAGSRPCTQTEHTVSRHRPILPRPSQPQCQSPFPLVSAGKRASVFGNTPEREEAAKKRRKSITVIRYEAALAAFNTAVNELCSPKTLMKLRQDLAALRCQVSEHPWQPLKTNQKFAQATEQALVNHLELLQCYFKKNNTDKQFATFKDRYQRSVTAEIFYLCGKAKKRWSVPLGPLFARAMLPECARKTDKGLKGKWKDEMRKNKVWYQLAAEFGCAILEIFSDQLTGEHLRRLHKPDLPRFISDIHANHPFLREHLKTLSDVLAYFVVNGKLPEEKLWLETLSEYDVLNKSREQFRELLSYCNVSLAPDDAAAMGPQVNPLLFSQTQRLEHEETETNNINVPGADGTLYPNVLLLTGEENVGTSLWYTASDILSAEGLAALQPDDGTLTDTAVQESQTPYIPNAEQWDGFDVADSTVQMSHDMPFLASDLYLELPNPLCGLDTVNSFQDTTAGNCLQ